MAHWNYRIVQYANNRGFGLHEVYYDEDGAPMSMTKNPASFVGDNIKEIHEAMMLARRDAIGRPVLIPPDGWE